MSLPLPAPRLSEAYEVLEVVRQGGLSTTLRARHRGSGELRCIDVLRPAPGQREVLERRLDADARPLMELRHPHIVRLVDAAVGVDGEACIVRENHEGVTLRRLTGAQLPSVPLAAELLRQAADALAGLHAAGRRVGDLAPEGVLVGRDSEGGPRLALGDLGLAKDWQEEAALTAAGLFIGRLRYAAPEQFEAGGRQAAPGDVYAWGLMAYELLTGQHPIAGDSASSLIAGHLFRPPADFADTDPQARVPDALRALVLSALAKAPDARPTAAEVRDDVARIQSALPASEPSELDPWLGVLPTPAEPSAPEAEPDESSQLDALLSEAHALARDEQFLEARDKVRKVLRIQPDHSMGLMLLASLEACLKIQVEESKAHETVRLGRGAVGPESPVAELAGGSQTLMLPTVKPRATPASELARAETGTETVRVQPAEVTQMLAAARGAGSQEPGAPASTERLDLPDDLDDGKTRPLSADLLRRLEASAEPAPPPPTGVAGAAAPPAVPVPAPVASAPSSAPPPRSPADLANGTTHLLDTRPEEARAAPNRSPSTAGSGSSVLPLPGTVTLPMEQIEREKRRALAAEPPSRPPARAAELGDLPTQPVLPAARRAPTPAPPPRVPAPPAAPAAADMRPAPVVRAPTAAYPTSFAESETPTPTPTAPPTPASAPAAAAPVGTQRRAASVDDLGFGGGAGPAPRLERAPAVHDRRSQLRGARRGRAGKRGGTGLLVGAAVVAVLVFAIGYAVTAGIDLRQLLGLAATPKAEVPPETAVIAADPGVLVLDAQPWAEIVQIIDPLGEDVPLRFRHTPARYELPPGVYTVIVSSPDGGRQTLELAVASRETTEARPVFSGLEVDEYFRLMGWK